MGNPAVRRWARLKRCVIRESGGKIAVFGSDMTTEIAQELQNYQVLKAVVDISGKKMATPSSRKP